MNGLWAVSTVVTSLSCRYCFNRQQVNTIDMRYSYILVYWLSTKLKTAMHMKQTDCFGAKLLLKLNLRRLLDCGFGTS